MLFGFAVGPTGRLVFAFLVGDIEFGDGFDQIRDGAVVFFVQFSEVVPDLIVHRNCFCVSHRNRS